MRTLLIIVLICTCCIARSQQKLKWQLVLELNGVISNPKGFSDDNTFYHLIDTPAQRYRQYTIRHSGNDEPEIRPGIAAGVRLSYPLRSNLNLTAGLTLSTASTAAYSHNTLLTKDTVMSQLPPNAMTTQTPPFGWIQKYKDVRKFVSIDLPVGISLNPGGSRWLLEAEIVPSYVVHSRRYVYLNDDDKAEKLPGSMNSLNFAAGIGAGYKMGTNWEVALKYRYGLNTLTSLSYPAVRSQSAGLQLRYSF